LKQIKVNAATNADVATETVLQADTLQATERAAQQSAPNLLTVFLILKLRAILAILPILPVRASMTASKQRNKDVTSRAASQRSKPSACAPLATCSEGNQKTRTGDCAALRCK